MKASSISNDRQSIKKDYGPRPSFGDFPLGPGPSFGDFPLFGPASFLVDFFFDFGGEGDSIRGCNVIPPPFGVLGGTPLPFVGWGVTVGVNVLGGALLPFVGCGGFGVGVLGGTLLPFVGLGGFVGGFTHVGGTLEGGMTGGRGGLVGFAIGLKEGLELDAVVPATVGNVDVGLIGC